MGLNVLSRRTLYVFLPDGQLFLCVSGGIFLTDGQYLHISGGMLEAIMRLLVSDPHLYVETYINTYRPPSQSVSMERQNEWLSLYMFLFFSHLLSTCIKDFEVFNFSILGVYQQKSLTLPDNHNVRFDPQLQF